MTQKAKLRAREKAARDHYEQYRTSQMTELYKAYGRWSGRKEAAWDHCKELCKEADGYGLKIITRNTDVFTAGFESVNAEGVCQFTYIAPTFHITIEITPDMV